MECFTLIRMLGKLTFYYTDLHYNWIYNGTVKSRGLLSNQLMKSCAKKHELKRNVHWTWLSYAHGMSSQYRYTYTPRAWAELGFEPWRWEPLSVEPAWLHAAHCRLSYAHGMFSQYRYTYTPRAWAELGFEPWRWEPLSVEPAWLHAAHCRRCSLTCIVDCVLRRTERLPATANAASVDSPHLKTRRCYSHLYPAPRILAINHLLTKLLYFWICCLKHYMIIH